MMGAGVSVAAIEAEAAAWPFTSSSAFAEKLLEVTCARDPMRDGVIRHLLPLAGGRTPETVVQMRNAAWFGDRPPAGSVGLAPLLSDLAARHLEHTGRGVRLRELERVPVDVMAERWRWLSLKMPADLLIAALAAREGITPRSEHVSLATPPLDRLLEKNLAETHLHVGAAVPFEILWTNLMTRIGMATVDAKSFDRGGRPPFGSGPQLVARLVSAAIARVALARMLAGHDVGGSPAISRALRTLAHAEPPPGEALLRAEYRAYARLYYGGPPPRQLEDLRRADPIRRWIGPVTCLAETSFLARALAHLQTDGDQRFARLFWQYVRVRCLVFRHLTQSAGVAGMDWFFEHYLRIGALRLDIDDALLVTSAMHLEARGANLESIEIRTSPGTDWSATRDLVRALAAASADGGKRPERGLVLHFLKNRNTGVFVNADPARAGFGCRYGQYRTEAERAARAVITAFRRHPDMLILLRGVDACTLELAVPNWVLLPVLAGVRRAAASTARRLDLRHRVDGLRMTLHAGEDFRTVLEGIRHVHEPIETGYAGAGDRVGHAIALGIDVDRWARASVIALQPAEARLEDLLWEMDRYRRGQIDPAAGRLEYVRNETVRLGRAIYGLDGVLTDEMLITARRARFSAAFQARLGYPRTLPAMRDTPNDAVDLVVRHWRDPGTYRRGGVAVEVPMTRSEVEATRAAQRYVRAELNRAGITVEANPSSNMLVGDLPLDAQPIFRLQPLPGAEAIDGPPVLVALGDDDPVTFASCLPEEICHVFYALIRQKVAYSDALEWVDRVRENAWRARFTLESSKSREVLARIASPLIDPRW